ncbi:SufS family cysteine desulfurase [Asaia prunellae]|uniref:SufS family cysteine desulfurase n=1 Tax=Asaia prunellae TaxID=610245 RepID=UPI0004727571|nr:cysteine desulfurase [Asaia prunellae]
MTTAEGIPSSSDQAHTGLVYELVRNAFRASGEGVSNVPASGPQPPARHNSIYEPVHQASPQIAPSPSIDSIDWSAASFSRALTVPEIPIKTSQPEDLYFLSPEARTPPGLSQTEPGRQAGILPFDVHRIRRDFPILEQEVNGHRLVWLDNAATTQKPQSVIDATSAFYERDNSNIHRAAHTLAARSTDAFEGAREKLRRFVGAREAAEIIFLRGTTEAINLVAQSYGRANIGPGDEILITTIEHHANIVPWQILAQQTGAVLRVAPVNDRGELLLDQFVSLLSSRTKLVSVTHVANSLGTVNPIEQIIPLAHSYGVPVLVDAAQSAPHIPLDVTALDVDFLVLSGHKIYGPTGIGILYGKRNLLEEASPWQGGGHMIRDVTFAKTHYQGLPEKFEAGTPDIAGAVGLGAAVDYLQSIGLPAIAAYEHELLEYASNRLASVSGLRLIGTAAEKASVLSFTIESYEPGDVARHLDSYGIAARSGHHCAQPALRRFGVEETVRASLGLYNTHDDIDALVRALRLLPQR